MAIACSVRIADGDLDHQQMKRSRHDPERDDQRGRSAGGCAALSRIISAPVAARDSAAAPMRASRDAGRHRGRRVLEAEQPQARRSRRQCRSRAHRSCVAGEAAGARGVKKKRNAVGPSEGNTNGVRDTIATAGQQRDRDEAVQKHEQRPDRALRIARQQVGELETRGEAARDLRVVDDERRRAASASATRAPLAQARVERHDIPEQAAAQHEQHARGERGRHEDA